MLAIVRLRGEGEVEVEVGDLIEGGDGWDVILTTEDAPFAPDARPPEVALEGERPVIRFARPAAVLLRAR